MPGTWLDPKNMVRTKMDFTWNSPELAEYRGRQVSTQTTKSKYKAIIECYRNPEWKHFCVRGWGG